MRAWGSASREQPNGFFYHYGIMLEHESGPRSDLRGIKYSICGSSCEFCSLVCAVPFKQRMAVCPT